MTNLKDSKSFVSIKAAAAEIKSGDTVWVGNTSSISEEFLSALAERQNELKNVTILAAKGNRPCKILDEIKYKDSFRVLSFFTEALVQTYEKGDKVEFIMSSAAKSVAAVCKQFSINAIAIAVCPPDQDGYSSVGTSGGFITPSINDFPGITKRIAIIDPNLPDNPENENREMLDLSTFDFICESTKNSPKVSDNSVA
ncbi:MAG: hypothetical protein GXY01_10990 [Clostridiales bacterium]|nr:hypothetical protein [Clostridiales bacterium]